MSITEDTKLDIAESGTTPITANYTCGANCKLLVLCIANDTPSTRSGGAPTYNGVDLIEAKAQVDEGGEGTAEIWYMSDPPVSSSLQISVPNTEDASSNNCTVMVVSFNAAADKTILFDKSDHLAEVNANPHLAITPTNTDSLICQSMFSGDGTTPSANSDVLVYQHDTGQEGNGSQYKLNASISSHDLTWTIPSDDWYCINAVFYETDPPVTVTDVETDEDFDDKDTNITITGTNFEASKGTGKVELGDNSDYATANKIEQTTTSWGDTSIDITVDLSTQSPGSKWIFVTNNTGTKNDPGFAVTVHRAEAFQMSLSGNIATGGENTTFQLTAPATKSTTDFVAGRIQDDENPADAVNITTDDYTELEWCFDGLINARDVQYSFRVTIEGTELDTYTLTPKLTITSGVGWTGKVNGITNPAKINGIAVANISKVNGV